MARARLTDGCERRHLAHDAGGGVCRRHVSSESPQRSHSGGVSGRIDCQQAAQTGPLAGWSSGLPHDAHSGESATARRASRAARARLLARVKM
jgi:hypothetical protein